MKLLHLAKQLDALDAERDWQKRCDIAEEMKAELGSRAGEFEQNYEIIVQTPAQTVLRAMGLAEPPAKAAPRRPEARGPAPRPADPRRPAPSAQSPAPDPLAPEDEARLKEAAAAYRAFRILSSQGQASEEELRAASGAWTAARDAFPAGSPAAAKLEKETVRIDQEIKAERARPPQHPHQLAGVKLVPKAKPAEAK